MKAFQEITAIKFVVGKDENGNDLNLTRVSWKRYDKDENGNVGPDHGSAGDTLFIGSVQGELLVSQLSALNLPEWEITTFLGEGVEAVSA